MRRLARPTLLLALARTLAACGAAQREPTAPATAPPPSSIAAHEAEGRAPETVDEARAAIERARRDIDALSPGGPSDAPAAAAQSPAAEAPTAQPAEVAGRAEARPGSGAASSSCARACSALASMRRAVDALCRMSGDADASCVDAKKTLDSSTARAARCAC